MEDLEKNIPCRSIGQKVMLSLSEIRYMESCKEERKLKHTGMVKGRRKIELSPTGDTSISYRIVDSLCNSEEKRPRERNPVMYVGSNLNSEESSSSPYLDPCSEDDFIEICLSSDKIVKHSVEIETAGAGNKMDISFGCESFVSPLHDGAHYSHKSLSGTVKAPHSPSSSESDSFSSTISMSKFSPIRKMFDPFGNSKSQRSPVGYVTVADNGITNVMENTKRNKTSRKSLLRDFLNAGNDSHIVKKNDVRSPFHLHGCLKLGAKHGVPFFEFSMNEPEDVFLAKALKADNGFNWIYTFHSVGNKKKSNAPIVAQMQVSSRLCSETEDGGDVDNSLATEFVLYDIARVHKVPAWSSPGSGVIRYKSDGGSNVVKLKDYLNHASGSDEVEFLKGPPADLHPNLEIVAIVIQVPFKSRENLKYRRGEKIDDKRHLNLLDVSMIKESKSKIQDSRRQEKVKVVIPTGNHSFPCAESQGPSSLLDRWRMGGGCDCGGWDMACPLVVFGNPGLNCFEHQPLVDSEQPFRLFIQGAKENTPALTMKAIEGGYAVDFHATLSALQAFSICVAMLHCTETSAPARETESKHLSQYNSLKMLIEEEVKLLIKEVTEEDKKKKVSKKVEAIPSSYAINPPFSPISRV